MAIWDTNLSDDQIKKMAEGLIPRSANGYNIYSGANLRMQRLEAESLLSLQATIIQWFLITGGSSLWKQCKASLTFLLIWPKFNQSSQD